MPIFSTGKALNNPKGFTLLELLVVLVLISLATALAAPRMTAPLENLQLKTAAKKIAAALRYSRSLAAGEKKNRICVFDFKAQAVRIYPEPEAGDNSEAAETPPPAFAYSLPKGVMLKQAAAGAEILTDGAFQLVFFASGASSGGDIVLANDRGRAALIHVDFITGSVEIAKPEDDQAG